MDTFNRLIQDVEDIKKNIKNLKLEDKKLRNKLYCEVRKLKIEINKLKNRVTINENEIKLLKERVSILEQKVQVLEQKVQALEDFQDYFIGSFNYSVRTSDYNGWLFCDGREISRTTYSKLFDLMGTQFGVGDGSTTFNLPNPASYLLGTAGSGSGLSTRNIGDTTGNETTTLTTNELPAHNHTGTTADAGNHTHTITDPGHAHSSNATGGTTGLAFSNGNDTPGSLDSTGGETNNITRPALTINSSTTGITNNNAGTHNHTFTTNNTGNGQAFSNMPPTLFIGNLFVYAGV